MNEDKVYAMQVTNNYFKACCKRFPHKTKTDALKAAWNYFIAFNSGPSISTTARSWFEQNIGKFA
jgi:pectate lyase